VSEVREGFIPLPEVHELQRFSNIPEYPYLRKYPARTTKNFLPRTPFSAFCLERVTFYEPSEAQSFRVML
jgi:hypothetical protein